MKVFAKMMFLVERWHSKERSLFVFLPFRQKKHTVVKEARGTEKRWTRVEGGKEEGCRKDMYLTSSLCFGAFKSVGTVNTDWVQPLLAGLGLE